MGRGVVEDVAKKMIADMAKCLEQRFAQPVDAAEPAAPNETAPRGRGDSAGRVSPRPRGPRAAACCAAAAAAPAELKAGSLFWTVLKGRIRALFRRR